MQFKTYLKSKLPLYLALSSLFMLASCGSYQYVGNDSDGIYSSSNEVTTAEDTPPTSSDNIYYKGYFAEKSQKYEKIAQDDNVIFTDIDDYEGTYNEVTGEVEYEEAYAGWGQDPSNVTINIYDNNWGWNNWGYGFNNWGWNGGWGYGFNNWGWNNGWGYGFNNWGWNGGWGYGFNNWGWNSGFGWCAPYAAYGGYYGYHNNNVAHNRTRRGNYVANSGRNSEQYNSRNNTTRRNTTTRNSSNTRYNPANSIRSNTRMSNSNVRSNTNTRSNTRVNTPTRSTRSNTRMSVPTRSTSSSPSVRRSSNSGSSSGGTTRSSGGSSRRGG